MLTLSGGNDIKKLEAMPPEKREKIERIINLKGESEAERKSRAAKRAREYADSWKPER